MYLLSGESLTKAEWFRPERQPLNLDGQKSTSSLTIGPEAPEIPIGAWMLDDEDPGAGIVWRVKTVDTQFDTKTRTVQLEHIVNTLKDISIFGEIAPKNITGNAGSTTCTARQAFEFILARHDSWQLGTMAGEFENISNPYSFNGEDLLSAMETITSSLEDAYWDFDLTSLPFRVNILKLGEDVGCEMRMSRNITTLRKTVDRNRMYTRIYPIGENDIHIDGDYISQNVDSYGLVVKIETDSSKKTKAELLQWAHERLARHCEPSVTITISGIELSEATGEPLDHFREHTKCRVPLPEFGTTITEKVTKLSWRDKIHEKKNVTITLANKREDIASIVNRINKKNGAGARAKAKKDKEDHAWFVDTEDHVGMVAEAIIGHGLDGVDWSRVSSLITDGEGIHGRVTRAEGYLVTMQGQMDMNEESLRIAFENMGSLRSEFAISAESMRIAFQNDLNCTRSEFQMTSESLRIAFENEIGRTRSEFQMTSESLRIAFENEIGSTRSEFQMTSESLRIAFENEISSTRSEFQMTSESLRIAFENEIGSVRSSITQQANRIGLVVEGTGSSAKVKRAAIVAAINGNTSNVNIAADKIDLGTSTVGSIFGVTQSGNDTFVTVNGDMYVDGGVYPDLVSVGRGGYYRIWDEAGTSYADVSYSDLNNMIIKANVTGNTLTLWKRGADTSQTSGTGIINFSKAVTLGGTWRSGSHTFAASVSPDNATNTYKRTIVVNSATKHSAKVVKVNLHAQDSDTSTNPPTVTADDDIGDFYINATDNYNAGWDETIGSIDDHPRIVITSPDSLVAGQDAVFTVKGIKSDNSEIYLAAKTLTVPTAQYNVTSGTVQIKNYTTYTGFTKTSYGTWQYWLKDGTSGMGKVVDFRGVPKLTVDGNELAPSDENFTVTFRGIASEIYQEGYRDGTNDAQGQIPSSYADGWAAARATTSGTYDVDVSGVQRTYPFIPTSAVADAGPILGVAIPKATVDGGSDKYYYYMNSSNDEATLRYGSQNGQIVARYKHNKYSRGWAAAKSWTSGTYNITIGSEQRTFPFFPTSAVVNAGPVLGVAVPKDTVDGGRDAYYYYLTSSNDEATLRYGSQNGQIVARYTHNKYSSGWAAAKSWTSGTYNITIGSEQRTYPFLPTSAVTNAGPVLGVAIPKDAVDGGRDAYYYYLTSSDDEATLRYGSQNGQIVARYVHNKYTSGWTSSYNEIGLNYSSQQNLGFDGSVTIYPTGKATPVADKASIISKGVKVTAPKLSELSIQVPSNASSADYGNSYKTVTLLRNGTSTGVTAKVYTPWLNYDENATVDQGVLLPGKKLKLNWGETTLGVWQTPSDGGGGGGSSITFTKTLGPYVNATQPIADGSYYESLGTVGALAERPWVYFRLKATCGGVEVEKKYCIYLRF